MVRVQNVLAALVFSLLLACVACMQLLQWYPANETLWYLNITFAREARPVLELFQYLPFDGLVQNAAIVLSMLGICVLATRRRSLMLTSATTHVAAYVAVFAVLASGFRTSRGFEAASASAADLAGLTGTLEPGQLALAIVLAISVLACLVNHYQIVSDLVRGHLSRA
jgi:hypothetical protein